MVCFLRKCGTTFAVLLSCNALEFQWESAWPAVSDVGWHHAMTPDGDIVVAGTSANKVAVAKFSGSNGTKVWEVLYGNGAASGVAVAADPNSGNIVVTGSTNSDLGDWFFDNGKWESFALAYAPNGTLLWARQSATTPDADDAAKDVTISSDGNIIFAYADEMRQDIGKPCRSGFDVVAPDGTLTKTNNIQFSNRDRGMSGNGLVWDVDGLHYYGLFDTGTDIWGNPGAGASGLLVIKFIAASGQFTFVHFRGGSAGGALEDRHRPRPPADTRAGFLFKLDVLGNWAWTVAFGSNERAGDVVDTEEAVLVLGETGCLYAFSPAGAAMWTQCLPDFTGHALVQAGNSPVWSPFFMVGKAGDGSAKLLKYVQTTTTTSTATTSTSSTQTTSTTSTSTGTTTTSSTGTTSTETTATQTTSTETTSTETTLTRTSSTTSTASSSSTGTSSSSSSSTSLTNTSSSSATLTSSTSSSTGTSSTSTSRTASSTTSTSASVTSTSLTASSSSSTSASSTTVTRSSTSATMTRTGTSAITTRTSTSVTATRTSTSATATRTSTSATTTRTSTSVTATRTSTSALATSTAFLAKRPSTTEKSIPRVVRTTSTAALAPSLSVLPATSTATATDAETTTMTMQGRGVKIVLEFSGMDCAKLNGGTMKVDFIAAVEEGILESVKDSRIQREHISTKVSCQQGGARRLQQAGKLMAEEVDSAQVPMASAFEEVATATVLMKTEVQRRVRAVPGIDAVTMVDELPTLVADPEASPVMTVPALGTKCMHDVCVEMETSQVRRRATLQTFAALAATGWWLL